MRNLLPLRSLLPLCLVGLSLWGCDNHIGQDSEPQGPLQVRRLTLLDPSGRDHPIFSDTSIPDCSLPENQDSLACHNDPQKDRYSLRRSPPNPDSAAEIRVVFNKIPLLFDGMALEQVDGVVGIACAAPCGVPPLKKSLVIIGSDVSFDPTVVPYGPALLLRADTALDPLTALEPGTDYQINLDPHLAGRDGVPVEQDDRVQFLLRFTTEPFLVVRAGRGAPADAWVYGTAGPYRLDPLPEDGALAVVLSASVYEPSLSGLALQASIGDRVVPVRAVPNQLLIDKDGMPRCKNDRGRAVYLYPDTPGRLWGGAAGEELQVTLPAAIRDVEQSTGHPAGHHTLAGVVVLLASLTGAAAGKGDPGLLTVALSATIDCP